MSLLDENQLGDLLNEFSTSAFRFETRETYRSIVGREPFRRFLAGEPDDYAWHRGWMDKISRDRAAGKVWQRVRIVSVPLSDYNRYGVQVARLSIAAGEDIRYLRRDIAESIGLHPLDAWLLDSERLVRLVFNDDDTFRGAERITDPGMVRRHLEWREVALRHAEPFDRFVARLP
ncbi:hypothetical protein Sru01_30880 [Sphaerisporangium rufum]|uniref:DUF6879 domain-containing protein n=1 Tax=Sphaerisporangium rufum TaxID=1381558 RepID=A0A919R483_9ACTN|nr:DUF6879 family protein [Sphaerisporangium rufum]GII78106.1 hypothetical protein Sru01_30880 [Sphaerisporangium rufum]